MKVAARLGAFLVAVALVVGALAVRGGDDGGSRPLLDRSAPPLSCPADLDTLCDALVALDDVDAERLTTATPAQAATAAAERLETPWLVPVAWADVVDDARSREGLAPLARSEVVASSPLLVVGFSERVAAIAERCGVGVEAVGIGCLDGIAGQNWGALGEDPSWGRVTLGHRAAESSTGLLATAAVAAAVAGPDFGLAELDDAVTGAAFRRLEDAVADFDPGAFGHVQLLRTRGPSIADLVVAVEADAIDLNEPASPFGRLLARPVETGWAVELVVVGDDADAVAAAADALADGSAVFDERGWRTGGGAPTGSAIEALPTPAARPDGPSLTALRSVWGERYG